MDEASCFSLVPLQYLPLAASAVLQVLFLEPPKKLIVSLTERSIALDEPFPQAGLSTLFHLPVLCLATRESWMLTV